MSTAPMTIDQFLAELRRVTESGVKWTLREGGRVRCWIGEESCCCPLTAIAWRLRGSSPSSLFWQRAGRVLGLEVTCANEIACAADHTDHRDPALRARLLEACGLKEAQQ